MPSLEAEKAARAFGSTARISAVPKSHRKPFYARKNSLGCAYSVTVCVLVSTTIVINHLIFGFSQLAGADMIEGGNKASTNPDYWDPDAGLFKAVFDVGLTFNATSQDAVELQAFAYSQLCQHTPYYPEIDCELQSDQMSVCVVLKCKQFQMSKQAVQMSYMYSIWELWEMKTIEPLPGEPAESISTANVTKEYGKPGAVVLFGFSFVWPHVKLALLHLFFYLPMTSRGRRNGNYWLAVFGKWSFTDVLVMSALVGVFHLTLDTTASEVWDSAGPDLIETCGGTCGTFMHEKTHPFEGIGQAIEAKLPPLQKFNDWNREQQDKMDAAWDEFVTKQKEKMDSAWDNVFHHGQAPSADFSCSCAWTANFACPDAPMPGNKGYAQKDNSACYAYCCPEDGAASQPSTGLASRIPKVTAAWDNFVDSMKAEMAKDPADRMGQAACASGCANLGKVIGEALDAVHPDLVSTLHAGVQMEGMVAMYSFCIAVMLSLIVSIVVERLEGRGEGVVDHHAEGWDGYDSGEEESDDDDAFDEDAAGFRGRGVPTPPPSPPAEGAGGEAEGGVRQVAPLGHVSVEVDTPGDEAGSSSAAPAAALDAGTATRTPIPETPSGLRRRLAGSVHFLEEKTKTAVGIFSPAKDTRTPREIRIERKIKRQMTVLGGAKPFPVTREWAWHSTICLLTSAMLAYGMFTPCFTREVTGSVPALLKDTGFDFDEEYSIWSLSGIIYELGGFNRALMYTTYLVFCVIGPAVRCSTQLMLLLLPLPTKVLRMLHELSRNASIFYALEVLLVAVPLLNVTFGPVSKNLLTVENSPGLCGPLGERYGQETCLMLDVRLAKGYWIICAHVALFLYSGFDGSPTHKYCQHELHRSDCPPFPCCSKQQQDSPPSARSARQPTMH